MLLKGLRVLDLSALLPGPMCSLFIADLGADVVKIESPKGDLMRTFGTANSSKSTSPYFAALNRNKKSVVLDLKTGEGKKRFMKLAKNADVIIEGFRPGKMKSLGIGYKNVRKINPRIIYCSITGYGQKGAYKGKAGHDLNYMSLSGALDILSHKPFVPGVQIADVSSAIIAAFSILAALFYRERSGKGNYIDVSMLHSALSMISMHVAWNSASKSTLRNQGAAKSAVLSGGTPCYNIYKTKDKKYVSLCAAERKFWESFCNAVNRNDLIPRQFDRDTIKDLISIFKSKTREEWVKLNKKHDFCCEPVKKVNEAIADINLINPNGSKMIIGLDGIRQASFPVLFSSAGKLNYAKAPKLGQHTEDVLSGL